MHTRDTECCSSGSIRAGRERQTTRDEGRLQEERGTRSWVAARPFYLPNDSSMESRLSVCGASVRAGVAAAVAAAAGAAPAAPYKSAIFKALLGVGGSALDASGAASSGSMNTAGAGAAPPSPANMSFDGGAAMMDGLRVCERKVCSAVACNAARSGHSWTCCAAVCAPAHLLRHARAPRRSAAPLRALDSLPVVASGKPQRAAVRSVPADCSGRALPPTAP